MPALIINIINNIAELLTIVIGLSAMQGRKLKIDGMLILLILYDNIVIIGINEFDLSKSFLFTVYITLILYCVYKFRIKIAVAFMEFIFNFIYLLIIELLLYVPVSLVIGDVVSHDLIIGCIVNILCFLINFFFYRKMGYHKIGKYIEEKNVITYICVSFLVCFLLYHIGKIAVKYYMNYYEYLEILVGLLLILILWFHLQKNKKEKNEKERQLQAQKEYINNFEKQLDAVKYKQHDIKHHISAFEGMWKEQNNKTEYKDYYEYIKDDSEYNRLILGGNPVVTGFLYEKIRQMQEKKIIFEHQIVYENISVVLSIYQWIEIMGILLDNAMEAIVKNKVTNGKIYMELLQTEKLICLKVMNENEYVNNDEIMNFFRKGYSNKGELRGVGLSKLKELVTKEGGEIAVRNVEVNGKNNLEFAITFRY